MFNSHPLKPSRTRTYSTSTDMTPTATMVAVGRRARRGGRRE
jgi:hypothetical protein